MVRCPGCRAAGDSIVLLELWRDHVIEFQQNADGTIQAEGVLRDGSPYGVQAWCLECDHHWRLRGITQITLLRRENNKNPSSGREGV